MPPRTGGPLEFLVTLEKLIEWLEDRAQVSDKLAVIIDHSKEGSQLGEVLRAWCLFDGFYFSSVGEIPLAEMTHPMYVTDFCINLHLLS